MTARAERCCEEDSAHPAGFDNGGGGREPRMWVACGGWKRQGNGVFLRASRKEHVVILAQRDLCELLTYRVKDNKRVLFSDPTFVAVLLQQEQTHSSPGKVVRLMPGTGKGHFLSRMVSSVGTRYPPRWRLALSPTLLAPQPPPLRPPLPEATSPSSAHSSSFSSERPGP